MRLVGFARVAIEQRNTRFGGACGYGDQRAASNTPDHATLAPAAAAVPLTSRTSHFRCEISCDK